MESSSWNRRHGIGMSMLDDRGLIVGESSRDGLVDVMRRSPYVDGCPLAEPAA